MRTFAALLGWALGGCIATPPVVAPVLAMPPRPTNALTGSELRDFLRGRSLAEREALLAGEFAAGNVPTFLRQLVPVQTAVRIAGTLHTATFWCTRDYFGFGGDDDWLRTPMTPQLAQSIADQLDCVLPTRQMVDDIWKAAAQQLEPMPFHPAHHDILSFDLFHRHHRDIEAKRGKLAGHPLIAGIKKDVVVSPLLNQWPNRVCIYGWHHRDGVAIQPLSKVHTVSHVDYSHGVRLVSRRVLVDGVETTIEAVLTDPKLHALLSDEGPVPCWRYPAGGGS